MEGKAVLFKTFAGIDMFDTEINETDPDKLVDIIAGLEPTFRGILSANMLKVMAARPSILALANRRRKSSLNWRMRRVTTS